MSSMWKKPFFPYSAARFPFFLLFAVFLVFSPFHAAASAETTIFAAASTADAVTEIVQIYEGKGLGKVKTSFASSSTLAKQIEQGAPAGIFLSANQEWMDYLAQKECIAANSRKNLLRNRIVLIAPKNGAAKTLDLSKGADLGAVLGKDGRLALGDPSHVPVGMYGRLALETLGMWDAVKDRLAPTKDVRAGLALVERGEAPLGLVYATDVNAPGTADKVRVVGTFPIGSHPDITYPAALVRGNDTAAAETFLTFLSSPEAAAVFKKYGFENI